MKLEIVVIFVSDVSSIAANASQEFRDWLLEES
jgi:hypothetical protein